MKRPKLTIPQQIKDMKESGIAFNVISESNASRFLENNTYYFKLKAYEKNYDKYRDTAKLGQYINLEFAYLKDLSTIDAHLRKIILKMSVDLEHFLKVKMLSDFNKVDEDGYGIIQELFRNIPDLKDRIEGKSNTSTCSFLINSYKDDWAIWNIIEVMSFGQFADLYTLFYTRNEFDDSYRNLLLPVRMLRNAAAHNNCLINRLCPPFSREITPNYDLKHEISNIPGMLFKALEKKLKNPTVHDLVVLIYLYVHVVPNPTKEKTLEELKYLFNERMVKHREYYAKNQELRSYYEFVKLIIDFYC
ncbi:MAG: Abi-like protein [Firmicutes bacterium HGW-Firmicutes-16]|nr:MAG: Abi-like protein [Firmicutes bacterium HGW-Firmicutes-16]